MAQMLPMVQIIPDMNLAYDTRKGALDKLNDRQQSLLLQMTNYKKYTDLRNKAVANYSKR